MTSNLSFQVIELSMEEVEQEHAEKQVDHILNTFLGLGIPIETVKVVRVVGSGRILEVIFPYEALARRVYTTFRLFFGRNRYLPRGFEKIRLDVKRTKRQELERMRRKGSGNMFYIIQNPPPVPPRYGAERYHHPHPQSCQQCNYPSGGGGGGPAPTLPTGGGGSRYGPYSASTMMHQQPYSHTGHGHSGHSHHHHHRASQPSPFPAQGLPPGSITTGRQHHTHQHSHGHGHHGHGHGKHTAAGINGASSTTNVPSSVYGRTGVPGSRMRADEEDPWRYTQTMWR